VLARRAPGGPPKAEPGVAPGRGEAQRSRLDLRTAQFGNVRSRQRGVHAIPGLVYGDGNVITLGWVAWTF
jgi:hypothetical protein